MPLLCLGNDFVNLTFDRPDLSGSLTPIFPGGPLRGKTSELLQGWTLLANGTPLDSMVYSPSPLGSARPATLSENPPDAVGTQFGRYSLILGSSPPNSAKFNLHQSGTIPPNATGFRFFTTGTVELRINGEAVGVGDPFITAYPEINVSRFAGQTVDLEFSIGKDVGLQFDIFGFTQIPEPSTWMLLGVGAAGLVWQRRRHRSR